MSDDKPRPNLNLNKKYLDDVSNLLTHKGELEDIEFNHLTDLFSEIGFEEDIYNLYFEEKAEAIIQKVLEESFEKININNLPEDIKEKLYKLWDYLSPSDTLEKADIIYVFGGISQLAVLEAIRLKKEDWAPVILFSGKRASYTNDSETTEAESYAQIAIENGVLERDILIEKESINTPENIVNSAQLLHKLNMLPQKVIAVSLPYHMRRASLTMISGFDWKFKLIRHPGKSAKYTRETYFKDKNGWSYIFFEYLKLYGARQMRHF